MEEENHHQEEHMGPAVLVTFVICLLELVGGWFSGSISLLSDAAHMFRDVFSIALSWIAIRMAEELPTKERTFGFHRTEIMAAFINGSLLLAVAALIMYQSIIRFVAPPHIKSGVMVVVAVVGLVVNLFVMFWLKGSKDLNIRSAYLHVLTDTLSSVAIIVGGTIIAVTGWFIVDPILSLLIAGYIALSSIKLLAESLNILFMGVPPGISVDEVIEEMKKVKGVLDVHGVHLWSLCSNVNVLDAHIHSCETKVRETCRMVEQLNRRLEKFNIKHTTLQFECDRCQIPGRFKRISH